MSKLFKHQVDGVVWLRNHQRAYLGDPPGMGKTLTLSIAAAQTNSWATLVVCPAIVRSHWKRTLEEAGRDPSYVKSYDEIVRGGFLLMAKMLDADVGTLIVDEAHYCKHATSQRTRILMGKDGYARRIENVWLASGTPMPKNPLEMFTQICYLAPEVLLAHGIRTKDQWKDRFCVVRGRMIRGVWTEKVVDVKNVEELKVILDVVMLRRETGIDLPEIWWQVMRLNGETDELTEGSEFVDEWERKAYGMIVRANLAEDLEDIAKDPYVSRMRRRLGELKVAPVAEMLTSQLADSVEKVAVFAYHTSVLRGLAEKLAAFGVAYIDGDVSDNNRQLQLEKFRTDPRCRVFIGQNVACGTGMDGLQYAARRAILVEPSWTAKENVQLGRRIARTGQISRETCIVQMIALANTLDDSVVRQNQRETEMADKVGM